MKKLKKAQTGGGYNWYIPPSPGIPAIPGAKAPQYTDPNQNIKLPDIKSQESNIRYGRQNFWDQPVTLNWQNILASQLTQGALSAFSNASPNSYQNATKRFNESYDPTSWLPQNPNKSLQAYYGTQQDGGIIDSYIRDFLFDEDAAPTKPEVKKNLTPNKKVTTSDVETLIDFGEEDISRRMRSLNRISGMLGNSQIKTKNSSVNINNLSPDLAEVLGYASNAFPGLVVSSGNDATHKPNSTHYDNEGVDIGANSSSPDAYKQFKDYLPYLKQMFGVNYLDEGNHIHMSKSSKGKLQQGGPIYTNNPKDPRLQAYNDSLTLSNINTRQKQNIKLNNEGIDESDELFDAMERLKKLNGEYPKSTLGKTKIYYGNDNLGKPRYDYPELYKKPVQPVVYQKPIEEAIRLKAPNNTSIQSPNLSGLPTNPNIQAPNFKQANPGYISDTPTKYSFTNYDDNKTYFKSKEALDQFLKSTRNTSTQEGDGYKTAAGYMQEGGMVNTTGYTDGAATANNPMNVIPTGDITMANVSTPVIAIPHKNNKAQAPMYMEPGTDYAFDADFTMEFKLGGTYDLTDEQIEKLKKLGYEIQID